MGTASPPARPSVPNWPSNVTASRQVYFVTSRHPPRTSNSMPPALMRQAPAGPLDKIESPPK